MNTRQKQQLKARAHKLKPIVFLGNNGLTANVKMEIDRGLNDHELIKIRIQEADREAKKHLFSEICQLMNAEGIQLIGNIGTLYRARKEG